MYKEQMMRRIDAIYHEKKSVTNNFRNISKFICNRLFDFDGSVSFIENEYGVEIYAANCGMYFYVLFSGSIQSKFSGETGDIDQFYFDRMLQIINKRWNHEI